MLNQIDFIVKRSSVETWVGRSLSDKEWEVMASEIESALDFYLDEEVERLFADIDSLVEEDSKYE